MWTIVMAVLVSTFASVEAVPGFSFNTSAQCEAAIYSYAKTDGHRVSYGKNFVAFTDPKSNADIAMFCTSLDPNTAKLIVAESFRNTGYTIR